MLNRRVRFLHLPQKGNIDTNIDSVSMFKKTKMEKELEEIKQKLITEGTTLTMDDHRCLLIENNDWLIKRVNIKEKRFDTELNFGNDFERALKNLLRK